MTKLTAKGAATRQRIIEGAARVIREVGVGDTTLDDIRMRTATSKSQLFHYFPSGRDELQLSHSSIEHRERHRRASGCHASTATFNASARISSTSRSFSLTNSEAVLIL